MDMNRPEGAAVAAAAVLQRIGIGEKLVRRPVALVRKVKGQSMLEMCPAPGGNGQVRMGRSVQGRKPTLTSGTSRGGHEIGPVDILRRTNRGPTQGRQRTLKRNGSTWRRTAWRLDHPHQMSRDMR